MEITFVGCGDAFGSGGRFNTCFHVRSRSSCFLIDCGASSMIALKALNLAPNEVRMIVVTHFHGDHFGGIPYFVLDAQFVSKRKEPLTILGPVGLQEWYPRVMETAFPGSSRSKTNFQLVLQEIDPSTPFRIDGIEVKAQKVKHGPIESMCYAYRIELEGKSLAYTGDTEWIDELIEIGHRADLLIAEAYYFKKVIPFHLNLKTLQENLYKMAPKRLILTHMSDDMLARAKEQCFEIARDGLKIEV